MQILTRQMKSKIQDILFSTHINYEYVYDEDFSCIKYFGEKPEFDYEYKNPNVHILYDKEEVKTGIISFFDKYNCTRVEVQKKFGLPIIFNLKFYEDDENIYLCAGLSKSNPFYRDKMYLEDIIQRIGYYNIEKPNPVEDGINSLYLAMSRGKKAKDNTLVVGEINKKNIDDEEAQKKLFANANKALAKISERVNKLYSPEELMEYLLKENL